MTLEYEYIPSQEEVRKHIQECEGRHTQQAVYSTFHDALTQVCYGCLKVRSTIRRVKSESEEFDKINRLIGGKEKNENLLE